MNDTLKYASVGLKNLTGTFSREGLKTPSVEEIIQK
jgi:hypothetical protein